MKRLKELLRQKEFHISLFFVVLDIVRLASGSIFRHPGAYTNVHISVLGLGRHHIRDGSGEHQPERATGIGRASRHSDRGNLCLIPSQSSLSSVCIWLFCSSPLCGWNADSPQAESC